ncbi:hypothetical protein GCM10023205_09950 [Yinghuangia aomiensis]|uniref:Phasin protein n=1 Tax=Yinghuangia aomiensis TaxID=676205 RepID=A0ABP9GR23_9ACTN
MADELPRLADGIVITGHEAAAACPGFATATALAEVTAAWQGRLAAVGETFARTAQALASTADRDSAADGRAAAAFDAAAR